MSYYQINMNQYSSVNLNPRFVKLYNEVINAHESVHYPQLVKLYNNTVTLNNIYNELKSADWKKLVDNSFSLIYATLSLITHNFTPSLN